MTLSWTILAAYRTTSRIADSSISLVATVLSSLLRLPFSLNVIFWGRTYDETFLALSVMLIESVMSATSRQFLAGAPAFGSRRIFLSVSVGALTGAGNSAAAVLSWALPRLTVVIGIF